MSGRFLDGRGEDPSELQWAAMTPYREAMPRLRTTLVLAVAVGCALVSGCAVQGADRCRADGHRTGRERKPDDRTKHQHQHVTAVANRPVDFATRLDDDSPCAPAAGAG
jgi:hypothetical protein